MRHGNYLVVTMVDAFMTRTQELDAAKKKTTSSVFSSSARAIPTFPFDLVVRVNSGVVYSGFDGQKPVVCTVTSAPFAPAVRARMDCSVICLGLQLRGPFVPFGAHGLPAPPPDADDWLW